MRVVVKGHRTLYDKLWDSHVVTRLSDGSSVLYVDRHLLHEVTSPQAFEGLRIARRGVMAPGRTLAVVDHNVPTTRRDEGIADPESATQIGLLKQNTEASGIEYIGENDSRQGIVHVIGPEQGFTLPGSLLVCGDSHTATHGAFGALAIGIGTSEVEHVLATQTLVLKKALNMLIRVTGQLPAGVTAKDLVLTLIGRIGASGASGHVVEFAGDAVTSMDMESRMTLCNMSIEAGARAALIAPDAVTSSYLKDRLRAPKAGQWDSAVLQWGTLTSDLGATFDSVLDIDASGIAPVVTWGTSPEDVVSIDGTVPDPSAQSSVAVTESKRRALEYMGLRAGQRITDITIDRVFIGSCTNGRISDLRDAARIAQGNHVAAGVRAMVVPGSMQVKRDAEREGLHQVFITAGFEWREPGCSMCLAMNEDRLEPGERCASTSNRNFVGRQGYRSRTHLVSPAMAAAAAIAGHFVDVRTWKQASSEHILMETP
jgi:3-isopropylmalate/(R)-2-methylmalate dehydratase large subunit